MLFLEPMLTMVISHCQDRGSMAGARVRELWIAEKLKCKLYWWNWENRLKAYVQHSCMLHKGERTKYTRLSTKSMRTVRFSFTELQ